MRHVGRIDPETKLPITEVTQAEFDALPSPAMIVEQQPNGLIPRTGSAWKHTRVGRPVLSVVYMTNNVTDRRLIIVEDSSPRVSYPSRPSVIVSPASASSAPPAGS